MTFYSTWCEKDEKFDPRQHAVEQIPIFHFSIEMAENEKPIATILTSCEAFPRGVEDQALSYVMISHKNSQEEEARLIFFGHLKALPENKKGEGVVTLTFEAELEGLEEWQKNCVEGLKFPPFHEALLDSEAVSFPEQFKDLLESHGLAAHISPTGGRKGELLPLIASPDDPVILDESILLFPLTQKVLHDPITQICIHVSAQWKQVFSGVTDISHRLKMAFIDALIPTFSGDNLRQRWWKRGHKAKKSGYWIEESELESVNGTTTGILRLYPAEGISKGQKLSWFRPRLRVGWRYIQKRREEAVGKVKNTSLDFDASSKEASVHIRVRPIDSRKVDTPWSPRWKYHRKFCLTVGKRVFSCTQDHTSSNSFEEDLENGLWKDKGNREQFCPLTRRGTFLESARGRLVMDYALNQAQRLLERSARAFEATVRVPFHVGIDLSCGDSILLQSAQVPAGHLLGALTHLSWHADGEEGTAWAELKVCATVGLRESNQDFEKGDLPEKIFLYAQEDAWEKGYSLQQNPLDRGSIQYVLQSQGPSDVFSYPDTLRAEDIVQRVYVKNDAYEQQRQQPQISPTSIRIRLRDLHGVEEHIRGMNILISNGFFIKSQVDLKELNRGREITNVL